MTAAARFTPRLAAFSGRGAGSESHASRDAFGPPTGPRSSRSSPLRTLPRTDRSRQRSGTRRETRGRNPDDEGALGAAYARAGRLEEARAIASELEAHPTSWNAFALAELHTALGDFDEAFRWLAYEPAHGWLPWSRVVPSLAPLRADPRFGDLMRRLNFDEVDER